MMRPQSIVRIDFSAKDMGPAAAIIKQDAEKSNEETIKLKEKELAECNKQLSQRVRDIIESQMFFAQMK